MASMIQIFGTKKCHETQKALRFFKERGIKTQFVDLAEKALSKGELESISRKIPMEDLINKDGKHYKTRNLAYMLVDLEAELLYDPLLLVTPITRFGKEATTGYQPDIWKNWINP